MKFSVDKVRAQAERLLKESQPLPTNHPSGIWQICNALCTRAGIDVPPKIRVGKTFRDRSHGNHALPDHNVLIFNPLALELGKQRFGREELRGLCAHKLGHLIQGHGSKYEDLPHRIAVAMTLPFRRKRPELAREMKADSYAQIMLGENSEDLIRYLGYRGEAVPEREETAGQLVKRLMFPALVKPNMYLELEQRINAADAFTPNRNRMLSFEKAVTNHNERWYHLRDEIPPGPGGNRPQEPAQAELDRKVAWAMRVRRILEQSMGHKGPGF